MEFLTFEIAKQLKGKRIRIGCPTYNRLEQDEFVVGEIVNLWEEAAKDIFPDGESRQHKWDRNMTEKQKEETKDQYEILKEDGSHTYIYCWLHHWYEGQFTLSDADRFVSYEEC